MPTIWQYLKGRSYTNLKNPSGVKTFYWKASHLQAESAVYFIYDALAITVQRMPAMGPTLRVLRSAGLNAAQKHPRFGSLPWYSFWFCSESGHAWKSADHSTWVGNFLKVTLVSLVSVCPKISGFCSSDIHCSCEFSLGWCSGGFTSGSEEEQELVGWLQNRKVWRRKLHTWAHRSSSRRLLICNRRMAKSYLLYLWQMATPKRSAKTW